MNKNDYIIRLECKDDYRTVENLVREAFWNVYRPGCSEHYILHQFRDKPDFVPELSLVLETDENIIGHIMYVQSEIQTAEGKTAPVMTFGPFCIAPEYQRKGYGKILLQYSMQRAKEMGVKALAISGDSAYYGKFGFVMGHEKGIIYEADPNAPYFLVKELEEGFFDTVQGYYKDPEGYFVADEDVDAFDAQFPYKEKLKLPGQLV